MSTASGPRCLGPAEMTRSGESRKPSLNSEVPTKAGLLSNWSVRRLKGELGLLNGFWKASGGSWLLLGSLEEEENWTLVWEFCAWDFLSGTSLIAGGRPWMGNTIMRCDQTTWYESERQEGSAGVGRKRWRVVCN